MTSSSFSHQPMELVDHISSFVESPKDLLSLSLTSKRACNVIIPRHIQFRHLRCDIRRATLWKRLAELPTLAARFVTVEITDEYDDSDSGAIFPSARALRMGGEPEFVFDCDVHELDDAAIRATLMDCSRIFASALRHMQGLRSFQWQTDKLEPTNDLLASLRACPGLTDAEILYYGDTSDQQAFEIIKSPLWQLSNLRKFSFVISVNSINLQMAEEYTSYMFNMLIHNCPCIQDLQLLMDHGGDFTDFRQFFRHGRWPLLNRLSLGAPSAPIRISGLDRHVIFTSFIRAHPNLRHLYLPSYFESSDMQLNDLLALRSVDLGRVLPLATMLSVPSHCMASQLEFLSVLHVDIASGLDSTHLRCLARIPTLRRLAIFSEKPAQNLMHYIAEAVPRIERLRINHGSNWPNLTFVALLTGEFNAYSEIMSRFQCLTHLSGYVSIAHGRDKPEFIMSVDLVVTSLSQASSTLQYIEIDTRYGCVWIEIVRNEYSPEWHYIDDRNGLEVRDWGEFYYSEAIKTLGLLP